MEGGSGSTQQFRVVHEDVTGMCSVGERTNGLLLEKPLVGLASCDNLGSQHVN